MILYLITVKDLANNSGEGEFWCVSHGGSGKDGRHPLHHSLSVHKFIGDANEVRMNHLFLGANERIEGASSTTLEDYHSEPVWDCHQASRFLRVHPATVKRLAREGKLPGFRIGNRWRFRHSELDAWARSTVLSAHSLRRE
jgi:excisionase family DNA binding protein